MKRRTQAQWQSLIQEFEQSGLTQADFCKERGINPQYFSLRRAKLKASSQNSPFAKALPSQPVVNGSAVIQFGDIRIQLPAASTEQIAQLVKALA